MNASIIFILQKIVSYLFKPQGRGRYFMIQIAGYFLLFIGGCLGLFFLFQALIPLIGYIESGAVMSGLFLVGGLIVLILGRRKKSSRPIDTIFNEAQNMAKQIDLENILKNNVHKILLASFFGGLLVSQLKDGKALSQMKDKLSQLKDFLK